MKVEIKNKVSKFFKAMYPIFLILISLICGCFIGYYYEEFSKNKIEINEFTNIKLLKTTSIAINEKNQLIIIDKNNGTYKIYEDSIGQVIFNIYANKLFIKETTEKKK